MLLLPGYVLSGLPCTVEQIFLPLMHRNYAKIILNSAFLHGCTDCSSWLDKRRIVIQDNYDEDTTEYTNEETSERIDIYLQIVSTGTF